MVIEVANEDERRIMETLLKAINDIPEDSLITVFRTGLNIRIWCNGRRLANVRLNNQLPGWRMGQSLPH